jgi:hypothetical protein
MFASYTMQRESITKITGERDYEPVHSFDRRHSLPLA